MLSNQYTWFKNFKMVSQNFDSQNVFDFNLCSHSCKGGNVFLSVGEGWDGPPGGSRPCWSGHITHNQTQMKHGAVPVSGTPEDLSSSTRSLGWEAGLGWLKSRRYIFHHGCTHQITLSLVILLNHLITLNCPAFGYFHTTAIISFTGRGPSLCLNNIQIAIWRKSLMSHDFVLSPPPRCRV